MARREIITYPNRLLTEKSEPVGKVTAEIRALVNDMFETMYDAPGIGLAAIQIGVRKRIVTMDLSKNEGEENRRVFINPEIVWQSNETRTYEEGCLSIPNVHEEVERPARVRVRYLDLNGKQHEEDADDLYATCIQHEVDHLNGILFLKYISRVKRSIITKRITKTNKLKTSKFKTAAE
jgi:peptide deformylase